MSAFSAGTLLLPPLAIEQRLRQVCIDGSPIDKTSPRASASRREPDRTGPSGTWQDPRSDAEAREVVFRVAKPSYCPGREHTGEDFRCIGGKGKRRGRRVLFEAADVARARNRHDKRLLRQQPGKR